MVVQDRQQTDVFASGHPGAKRKFLVLCLGDFDFASSFLVEERYLRIIFPVESIRVETKFDVDGSQQGPKRAFRIIQTMSDQNDWQESSEPIFLQEGISFIMRRTDLPGIRRLCFNAGTEHFKLDQFCYPLEGLYILEVEMQDADERPLVPDGFDVIEVTRDLRFCNKNLALIESPNELAMIIEDVVRKHRSV